MTSLQRVCPICQLPGNLFDLTSKECGGTAKKLSTIRDQARNDSLPRCICRECIEEVDLVYGFLQRYRAAEQRLPKGFRLEKEVTTVFVNREPVNTTETEQQLLNRTIQAKCMTEEDLAHENRKAGILEDTKQPTDSRQSSSKSYNSSKDSERDEQSPQREEEFICHFCAKAFASRALLAQHHSVHSTQSNFPFECAICGKSFKFKGTLGSHLLTHVKKNSSYECHVCSKKFGSSSNLNRHRKVHTDEQRYKCHQCDMTFWRNDTLKRHQIVHTGKKPYECTICGKAFRHQQNIIRHKTLCHDKPIVRPEASENKNKTTGHREGKHGRRTEI